jgi:hypothetical protein
MRIRVMMSGHIACVVEVKEAKAEELIWNKQQICLSVKKVFGNNHGALILEEGVEVRMAEQAFG